MRKLLLALWILGWLVLTAVTWGCGPKCLRGHQEVKEIPAHEETEVHYIEAGSREDGLRIPIYTNHWVPVSYQTIFVCDEYERPQAEKE